jgi:hypothetical protein
MEYVGLGQILGRLHQNEEIGFVYYFGDMNGSQRTKALTTFEKNPEAKVLVCLSFLLCGFLGLQQSMRLTHAMT